MHSIRQPIFAGRCAVRALWFERALLGEAEARRRIIARWRPGARLFGAAGGYVLEWPDAAWHKVEDLDGLALCQVGGVLSSAPLAPSELADLAPGSWWLVRDGQMQAAQPEARINPSQWLNLDGIALREPLAMPLAIANSTPDAVKSVRDILGDRIPAPSEAQLSFLDNRPQVSAGGLLAGLLGMLTSGGGSGQAQSGSSILEKLAMFTRISRLLGWRQAAYLRKMMDMFEGGDLHDALRHAIPLRALNRPPARPSFGLPGVRADFTVRGANGGGSSIGVDAMLEAHLRATYRRSFERLNREGKIDEAVFVLAELLQCHDEAVTYLESQGRLVQAAELADTLQLAPAVRVRLWVLAGQIERAVRIARLHDDFSVALRLLEQRQSEHAAPLRRQWAEYLAARGDFAEAIDAIWPLPAHHALALACMVQAGRAGGTLGVRALVRKLALMPAALGASAPAIEALLAAEGEEGVALRARLAQELIALQEHSASTQRLAAALARVVIPDSMGGSQLLVKADIDKLVTVANAAILRADLPSLALPATTTRSLTTRPGTLTLTMGERALLPIHDARCLPDGQYLLALGEGGVVRIGRQGRQLAHYPVPAAHLVLSRSGQRALALAPRDGSYRISRLDLVTGKVGDWLSMPLSFWSDRYDGMIWNVAHDRRVMALDTSTAQLAVRWQVADLPGPVAAYKEEGDKQVILLMGRAGVEQWTWAQPGRQLRQRDAWPIEDHFWTILPNAGSGAPFLVHTAETAISVTQCGSTIGAKIELGAPFSELDVQTGAGWILARFMRGGSAHCLLASARNNDIKAEVILPGAHGAGMRRDGEHLLIWDQAGRLVHIDFDTSQARTLSLS